MRGVKSDRIVSTKARGAATKKEFRPKAPSEDGYTQYLVDPKRLHKALQTPRHIVRVGSKIFATPQACRNEA